MYTAFGVHYDTTLAEAKLEFEKRGYKNISRFDYFNQYGEKLGCNEARYLARNKTDLHGYPFCYEYERTEFIADAINPRKCRIYVFDFEDYTGEPGDEIHEYDCRNCGK